jgi:hypothetical protein
VKLIIAARDSATADAASNADAIHGEAYMAWKGPQPGANAAAAATVLTLRKVSNAAVAQAATAAVNHRTSCAATS